MTTSSKESWGSRVGLVLAMAGNAVGLGNFLRFPVQAVQHGGGAYLIPYIICFLLLGLPLLWVEWAMGRFGGRFGHHSAPFILHSMDRRVAWKYIGVFGIFTNLAVAGYYCYLESWTMAYAWHSAVGTFDGLSQGAVAAFFDRYLGIEGMATAPTIGAVGWFVGCVALNTIILSFGLAKGVELTSKVGMPLLLVFSFFLAYKALTLHARAEGAIYDGLVGFNYLWQPQFGSLTDARVWLAAAGQVFFTLSVGMGTIQCYASYVKQDEDIALNAVSAGFMNEFVEVVLGSAILIPIAVGYLGIDKVLLLTKSGGLGLGFRTMPYLFSQWGAVVGAVAGVSFFGLLFFAGITSSLAMGTPWMGFVETEFGWSRRISALTFGLIVGVLGLPAVYFFAEGVFDEYDFWMGTVSLVFFALLESILFSWVFGLSRGWREITDGADIKVPRLFIPIIRFVTPIMLLAVFVAALITPTGGDWGAAVDGLTRGSTWIMDDASIVARLANQGLKAKLAHTQSLAEAAAINRQIGFVNGARALLALGFLGTMGLVWAAYQKRRRAGGI